MTDNILEISRQHGENMYQLGLEHALELVKIYKSADQWDELQDKLDEEIHETASYHDPDHRAKCDQCRADYEDALQAWGEEGIK